MELKPCASAGPKLLFEKIKFKVLHLIPHDFIHQRPGLSKDQNSMLFHPQILSHSPCKETEKFTDYN